MQDRLQKIMARAGVASRRAAEEMILQGRVRVNGAVVSELGVKADPASDHIKVAGKLLRPSARPLLYLMLHKPKGCMTTRHDPQGRPTVMDCLKGFRSRVFPVGRLDYHSEGLLLLTNDGEFAAQVISAKNKTPKTYHVKVNGNLTRDDLRKLRQGVKLDGRLTAPAKVRLISEGANPWYKVTLIEGRNRQIRRMFQRRGFLVEKLKRVQVGSLSLGRLPAGEFRRLDPQEAARVLRGPVHDRAGHDKG